MLREFSTKSQRNSIIIRSIGRNKLTMNKNLASLGIENEILVSCSSTLAQFVWLAPNESKTQMPLSIIMNFRVSRHMRPIFVQIKHFVVTLIVRKLHI